MLSTKPRTSTISIAMGHQGRAGRGITGGNNDEGPLDEHGQGSHGKSERRS